MNKNKKTAFTLAEVLIVLGVLGVVAILTMPTLMTGIQTKGYETSAKVFEGRLEEAMKSMNQKRILSGHTSTADFVNSLSKVMKISKICDSSHITDCFPEVITYGNSEVEMKEIKSAKNFGQKDWDTETVGLMFANGTSAVIAYNPSCKQDRYSNLITGSDCYGIVYDTTGFGKPNTLGKDIGSLQVTKLGKACAVEAGGACLSAASIGNSSLLKSECEKRRGELGIRACSYINDFWAGAVAACGGVDKMADAKDLEELASYLYGTNISGNDIKRDLTLNYERAAEIGIKVNPGDRFFIWTGEEVPDDLRHKAYNREFGSTYTQLRDIDVKRYNYFYYMCKE